ncbi:hypothetical protein F2Q70_00032829 [Brassica cretica]|uniref:Terpene synthase N-terminal domain-containing protein n=1 Tax=Brassica cretica TaxID=69181 RepID=A0A8S9FKW1_BRACR|nr:hypothetical protein F2Q70_00032829 [Brassica cretica]
MSVPTKPPKFVRRLKATTTMTSDDQESNRTFTELLPSPWTDQFHSVSVDASEMDALRKEIDVIKPKVKNALMSSQGIDSAKKRILMIYLLVSLGLAHHFEDEIDETLKESFEKKEEMMEGENDLYTVSTIFWVFRRYGHHISSDVFRRFTKDSGNFKESLVGDAKGMLSLYEAAYLRKTKDYIMDEALIFTSRHLDSLAADGTIKNGHKPRITKGDKRDRDLPREIWEADDDEDEAEEEEEEEEEEDEEETARGDNREITRHQNITSEG